MGCWDLSARNVHRQIKADEHYGPASRHLAGGRYAEGVRLLNKAIALDPNHYFWGGPHS